MMYFEDVRSALASDKGCDVFLQLMSLLEEWNVPFTNITISVKVPPSEERRHIGTLFGNVDVEVRT